MAPFIPIMSEVAVLPLFFLHEDLSMGISALGASYFCLFHSTAIKRCVEHESPHAVSDTEEEKRHRMVSGLKNKNMAELLLLKNF